MIEPQMHPVIMHIQTLGWVFLNFIWQGLLLAVVLKGLFAGIKLRSAKFRYNVALAVLIAMLAIPVASFFKPHLLQQGTQSEKKQTAVMPYSVQVAPGDRQKSDIDNEAGFDEPSIRKSNLLTSVQYTLPWFCAFWFAGVLVAFTRTLGGLIKVLELKKGAKEYAGKIDLPALTRKLSIRSPVRLLESPRITVPSVIGWFKPVILLPERGGFPPEQTRALVAHELAHVRRRDHLVNLFQVFVEVILFYHPGVWWVSSQIRIERESCCDDAAISACGDVKTYVRSLTEAERHRSVSKWAVAASGASLINRIRRIIEMKKKPANRFVSWPVMILGVLLIATVASGSSLLAYVPGSFQAPTEGAVQIRPEVTPPSFQVSGAHPVESVQVAVLKGQSDTSEQTGSEQLDTPSTQIMIESMIVEMAFSELEKFGILKDDKAYSTMKLAELKNRIQSGRIKANILSNPKLLTLDQKEGEITMGKKVHYMEKTGDGLYKPRTLETPIGIQLSITPTVIEELIRMDLKIQVSAIAGRLPSEVPDLDIGKPTIRKRTIAASFLLKDGETVAIGGGFKKDNSEKDNETIAFITANIVGEQTGR